MSRALRGNRRGQRPGLRRAIDTLGYEVIPFRSTEQAVLAHVPKDVRLTVTASATRGQDATVDLAVALAGHGYTVAPHLSARLVRDHGHLERIVGRCVDAGIDEVFVIGGDRSGEPAAFGDALDLLTALHRVGHGFTDIGIGGHPEGHPAVAQDVLLTALAAKAPLATHIVTQIAFDPAVIVEWAQLLLRRDIDLPVVVGVPGAVHRAKLLRVSGSLGIGASAAYLAKQRSLFWRFFLPGGYRPDPIIAGLAEHFGGPDTRLTGLHVFTFNDLAPTEQWRQRILRDLR